MTTKSYTVRFQEWVVYSTEVEASSPQAAIRQAYDDFCEAGTDGCRIRDNGTECWEAEADGVAPFFIDHPTDLDDGEPNKSENACQSAEPRVG